MLISLILVFQAGTASAQETPDYQSVIVKAADNLLATQNDDGGWEWMNPDTDPSTGVPSPANTRGVTAQGLLDAYVLTRNPDYLAACIKTYDNMVVLSEDADPAKRRIRGPDVPFLVELSEVTGDPTYADFARDRYENALDEFGNGTATGFAQYIRNVRIGLPAVISWDINLYIQGALALDRYYPENGYDAQAENMAEVIYGSLYVDPVDFDLTDNTQNEYWIAYTGAIEAFTTTGTHGTEAADLTTTLISSQQPDGRFIGVGDGSDAQTTAYAVMALLKAGETDATIDGASYLISAQLLTGGYQYDSTGNTEVTSEATQALFDTIQAVGTVQNSNTGINYITIQEAIDAASPGDTVLVHPGTYEESVVIDKPNLTLKSVTLHEAIIDGGTKAAVLIKAEGVTIDGFKILSSYVSAVYAYTGSDNVKVRNNIVEGGGIYIDFSQGAEILGNGITDAPHIAIFCFGDEDIVIENNEVIGNVNGILVHQSDGATVRYNKVSGITGDAAMQIVGSRNVRIEFNEITGNDAVGIQHGTAWWEGAYTPENNVAHYNNIVGNELGVQNWAETAFDATLNWWGDPTGPRNPTTNPSATGDGVSGNVGYIPWLDAPYPGGNARNWNVQNADTGDNFNSIQAAIDAADNGETVLVHPGTYEEYILIDKPLTVKSTDRAEETIIDGIGFRYMVRIYSSDVTFEGFTVTNPTYEGGADASGILIGAYLVEPVDNVHILNNIVKAVRNGTSGTPSTYGATGINIGRAPLSNVVVSGNTIENIKNPKGGASDHTCGINVWDGAENVVISNNTISDIKYNGILLEYANQVQVVYNTVTGSKVGIAIRPWEGVTVTNVTVQGNTFQNNAVQVRDNAEVLDILNVVTNNTFDRAVIVETASYLPFIWSSIQDAIDNASPDDNVLVYPGMYEEQIIINKSLTLEGEDSAKIVTPPTLESYKIAESGRVWEPVVFAYGGTMDENNLVTGSETIDFQMSGFEIDGTDYSSSNRFAGILARNVEGTLSNNEIYNLAPNSGNETFGIVVYGDSEVTISNNIVRDFTRGGIGANGDLGGAPDPEVVIEQNTITRSGISPTWAPNGIQVGFGATGVIRNNRVSWSRVDNPDWDASGILIFAASGVEVIGNVIDNSDAAIAVAGWGPNWGGAASDARVENNIVTDSDYGISIEDNVRDVLIRNNVVEGNLEHGILIVDYDDSSFPGTPKDIRICYNNILNNENYGVMNKTSEVVNAILNWWGDPSGPSGVSVGKGDAVSENVDYYPWLPRTLPTISDISVSGVTTTSATITWTTALPADSRVEYGPTIAYGLTSSIPDLTTSHSLGLTGLTPSTTYHFRVGSEDAYGHVDDSGDLTFITAAPPPPATLTVGTTPIKANVYVDGSLWGVAPRTMSLAAGTYTISFGDVLGYLTPAPEIVTLAAGETRTVAGVYTEIPPENIENQSPTYDLPSITPEENATILVENTALTDITIQVKNAAENVKITVQEVTENAAGIAIGAPGTTYKYLNIVAENITDAQIGSVAIRFKVEKSWIIANGIDIATITLNRYDPLTGEWTSLPTTYLSEDDTYVYFSAISPGLSIFGVSGSTIPANFKLSNLVITPSEVSAGKTVTISVVVNNAGGRTGSTTVTLEINGVAVDTRSVTLDAGKSTTVTFTVSEDVAGTYTINVAGLTGSFVVTALPALPIIPLAVSIIIIVLAISIVMWRWRIRRRA